MEVLFAIFGVVSFVFALCLVYHDMSVRCQRELSDIVLFHWIRTKNLTECKC